MTLKQHIPEKFYLYLHKSSDIVALCSCNVIHVTPISRNSVIFVFDGTLHHWTLIRITGVDWPVLQEYHYFQKLSWKIYSVYWNPVGGIVFKIKCVT